MRRVVSIVMKLQHLSRLVAVGVLLPLVCACYDYDAHNDMMPPQIATANQYINLTITVSSGSGGTTRAPLGGEDGDGREAGFARENSVEGITLMLYEDADGINMPSNATTTLAFIAYYPVTRVGAPVNQGTSFDHATPSNKDTEAAYYTTGNQSLENSGLDLGKSYHAIVVANVDLTSEFTTTTESKVTDVRDYKLTKIYDGTGLKADAKNFVMSSEQDCTINFAAPTSKTTTTNGETYYYFDDIYIERLAARVDFWTKGAEYKGEGYETPGYEYDVTGGSGDKFVLTHVTPFNLYDNNKAGEYLIKRLGDADRNTVRYLEDEPKDYKDQQLYVLDPNTLTKSAPSNPSNLPDLSYMNSDFALSAIMENNTQKMPMTDFQSTKYRHTENNSTADNIIVCYPKENTLLTTSPLYYYATGLCIEGDYYKGGTGDPTHYVYYGYLRHQGEETGSYTITENLEKDEHGEFPMNFGVVRNNIYRISIDEITERGDKEEPEKPAITWRIMVKNWDVFKHETIFM